MKFPAFEPIDLKSTSTAFEIAEIDISRILPDKNQARKNFDENLLEELASSIMKHGVIQPIIIRRIDNTGNYRLVAGERRWRAAQQVGLRKIPAIIREYDKSERLAVALIENIQRENLNPLEEAQAIQSLLEECSMTHSQVAESIGRSRAAVSNLLRLLNLEVEVKAMINEHLLEMGHARALLILPSHKQIEIANIIIDKNLSVRETEKLVHRISNNHNDLKEGFFINPKFQNDSSEWVKNLSKKISSKVNLQFNPSGKGKFIIHFDSIEEAYWLMDHIRIDEIEKM